MFTFITWPATFDDDIFTTMGTLVGEFAVPLAVIFGVLVFAVVIAVLMRALHR